MKKQKQKTKLLRCQTCKRFISPDSKLYFCREHWPEIDVQIIDSENTPGINDIEKIKENWPAGNVEIQTSFKDIEDEQDGIINRVFRIPLPSTVDFKTEFVYLGMTADQIRSMLGKIKLDFGGSVTYDVYIKKAVFQ